MAKFTSPSLVSEVIWNLRLADLPRGTNRGLINSIVNGNAPYTEQERQENNIEINVNFLDATQLCADARRSLYNAFQAPGKFFSVTFDSGPVYKRQQYGREITSAINRIMKRSRLYAECLDSQFAATVLHGFGPAVWPDRDVWCPEEKGIEDVLIPGDTLRNLRNLDHFAVFYQYTPEQLWTLTHGPRRDPAWNMPMVDAAIKWAHSQTMSQLSYSDLFSPEKVEERFKQDLGFYGTDAVPTIDFWKFYYHEDKKNEAGWRARAIIDTPGDWEVGMPITKKNRPKMPDKNLVGEEHNWLYNPGDRVYAQGIEELVHFQMGDLSAVSPFHIHAARGLGWLLYAVCHLQNRLLCKFNEAVFENLMQYFRGNEQDKTRVQKVDLHHFGFVPDGVAFVRPEERWQVNAALVEQAIDRNRQRMEYSAAQYRQRQNEAASKEKTATEIMAEVNSAMAMVGALLTQAYRYQTYGYNEIARRFCRKDSKDVDVKKFRAEMKAKLIPDEMLNVERWNIEPEKVMGSGNKTLQIAMADALLQMRGFLDPDSQKVVDRINIAAKTDNDDLANRLVPEQKSVSGSAHDAASGFGTLMLGAPVPVAPGVNHQDSIEVLMADMAAVMQQIQQRGMPTMQEITGLRNVAMHIAQNHMQPLAQDKSAQPQLKTYGKELGMLMKQLKAWMQQMQKAQQQDLSQQIAGSNGGMDPKDAAKIQATKAMAQAKIQNTRESHADRTSQKRISFEREELRKDRAHALEMKRKMIETKTDVMAKDLEAASNIRKNRLRSLGEQSQP